MTTKSNLQLGRDKISKYLYYSTDLTDLCNDIRNFTYQQFNIKYNTNFSSDSNFEGSLRKIYGTYYKKAFKPIDKLYRDEIKKAYYNRGVPSPNTDWKNIMTDNFPTAFSKEKIDGIISSKGLLGYYFQINDNIEGLIQNWLIYLTELNKSAFNEAIYFKHSQFSDFKYFQTFLVPTLWRLRISFNNINGKEAFYTTQVFDCGISSTGKLKYEGLHIREKIQRFFTESSKQPSDEKANSNDNNINTETALNWILFQIPSLNSNQFMERAGEIGKRGGLGLRYE